jgi:hypothetical protein
MTTAEAIRRRTCATTLTLVFFLVRPPNPRVSYIRHLRIGAHGNNYCHPGLPCCERGGRGESVQQALVGRFENVEHPVRLL